MKEPHENTICVDFDGVINDYSGGFKGPYIFGAPIEGAFEFIDALLTRGYKVLVFTARCQWPNMDRAIRDWFIDNGFPQSLAAKLEIDNVKKPAKIYLDDRAINFSGTWPTMTEVENFEPWAQAVRLVTITPDAEQLIAYCARVSNPDNQDNEATAGKLLKYLAKHHHWSPFEMAHAVLEIKAPRDITRQILRHRSFSFQEFSQRYAEVQDFTERLPRLQDNKNRQNSLPMEPADWRCENWANICVKRTLSVAKWAYEHALEMGIAKEVARVLLPEGLTMSTLYVAGSIRSWIHYCQVRMDPSTQLEHREIAEQCWKIITEQLPSLATLA